MKARPPLIAALVSGALVLLLIVFLVLPKMRQVSKVEEDVQAARDQEITLQAQLRSLQDAQAQAAETEAAIRALEDKVPATVDLPGLFRLLQSAADRAAVDFFQFSPGSPAPDASGAFSTVSSQIVITGTYFTLQEFLYSLESLPRAAKVIRVALSPVGGGEEGATTVIPSGRLTLQATVEFYTTDPSAGPGSLPGPSETSATPGTETPGTATDVATDAANEVEDQAQTEDETGA